MIMIKPSATGNSYGHSHFCPEMNWNSFANLPSLKASRTYCHGTTRVDYHAEGKY